jgi:hypothetical protein
MENKMVARVITIINRRIQMTPDIVTITFVEPLTTSKFPCEANGERKPEMKTESTKGKW